MSYSSYAHRPCHYFVTSSKTTGIQISKNDPFRSTAHIILQCTDSMYFKMREQPRGLVVRFPVLPWGFFLNGESTHGDHGLGSVVELRFKAPPGTSYPYITIHLIGIA